MPRLGDSLKKALAGLMVLLVIVLPAANASVLPSVSSMSVASILSEGENRASTEAQEQHSGAPCDDCDHRDNLACCLSYGFLMGNVPTVQLPTRPTALASLQFLLFSVRPPDGLGSAPDLPPPRQLV